MAGLVVAGGLAWAFLARRGELASESAADAPVVGPHRLQGVDGPFGGEAALVIDSGTLARLNIATRVLRQATAAGTGLALSGELVADPSRMTTVRAAVAGRLAGNAGRWPALGELVGAGEVVGQVSDARPLSASRAGSVTRVSAQPGEIVQAGQVLLELTDLSQFLARIVWRTDAPATAPATLLLSPLADATGNSRALAQLIGPAAGVDSLTRAPVYLYRVPRAWPGARPGTPIVAMLRDARSSAQGVLVPSDAVVQWQALAWAYIEHGRGRYVRRRVDTSHPVPGGWLVTRTPAPGQPRDPWALAPGDTVVVRGAQILLSEEFRAHAPAKAD